MSHLCRGKEINLGFPKGKGGVAILTGEDPPSRGGQPPSSPLRGGERPGGTINASVPRLAAERLCGVTLGTEAHPGGSHPPLLTCCQCAQGHVCSGAQEGNVHRGTKYTEHQVHRAPCAQSAQSTEALNYCVHRAPRRYSHRAHRGTKIQRAKRARRYRSTEGS
ncbi:UNVERIFIED_CONTAM: hypothetical protein FKN15_043633 [Acipenser sinensis]